MVKDSVTKVVAPPSNDAAGPNPSTTQTGDSSLMMAWISGFGMMNSSSRIGMLFSTFRDEEASTCNLSKAAVHPLEK